MLLKQHRNLIIIHAPQVSIEEPCFKNAERAIELFNLDSCCPLEPAYHRQHGIFECNLMYHYAQRGVELHQYCIFIRADIWEKISTLDIHSKNFITEYAEKIKEIGLKHALICNALVYAS